MRRRTVRGLAAGLLVAGGGLLMHTPSAAGAPAPAYEDLVPGGQPDLDERLPVNVVLVGYDAPAVDARALERALPTRYRPIVRSRQFYGVTETLGIDYRYDYDVRYTGRAYEDRFFRELRRLAKAAPLTRYQKDYNAQKRNVRAFLVADPVGDAVVTAELELGQVAVKVLLTAMLVDALPPALEDREIAFDGVGMGFAAAILSSGGANEVMGSEELAQAAVSCRGCPSPTTGRMASRSSTATSGPGSATACPTSAGRARASPTRTSCRSR